MIPRLNLVFQTVCFNEGDWQLEEYGQSIKREFGVVLFLFTILVETFPVDHKWLNLEVTPNEANDFIDFICNGVS